MLLGIGALGRLFLSFGSLSVTLCFPSVVDLKFGVAWVCFPVIDSWFAFRFHCWCVMVVYVLCLNLLLVFLYCYIIMKLLFDFPI